MYCLKEKDVYSIVPIWERFLLTIKEASIYFNLGENKMHRIANEYVDSDYKFVVQNGGRTMIKRKMFEDFLNQTTSIQTWNKGKYQWKNSPGCGIIILHQGFFIRKEQIAVMIEKRRDKKGRVLRNGECQRKDGLYQYDYVDLNGKAKCLYRWKLEPSGPLLQHIVEKYNKIYKVQMPKITPHVCRHTYCSHYASSGMNPKHLQYLMGHSDISVTLNTYTHVDFDNVKKEVKSLEKAVL